LSARGAGEPASAGPLHVPLYAFALVSGSAALIYQVVWTKMLSFTFGSTTLAASAVVAGFMGGMGLGAWWLHRIDARVRAPLRLYAGLELGIALSTGALTLGFAALPGVFAAVATSLGVGLGLDLFRVAFVLLLLVVPSAFMGATYPALCIALIHDARGVDRHLGWLYGLNTVGAAAGALVAGFLLIEALGLRASALVANAINVAVGLAAFVLARGLAAREGRGTAPVPEALPSALPTAVTALVLFGSGFLTLAYEILWLRALRYVMGNGTYALTTMLVVFLLGLGIGALLFRPLARRPTPERDLGTVQLGIGLAALFAIGGLGFVMGSDALASRLSTFEGNIYELGWVAKLAVHAGLALALMLPATLLMGLSFPLATRLFLGDVSRLGARVGLSYLLANLGSILGAVGAAVWILPALGTVGGTRALATANAILGAVVLGVLARREGDARPLLAPAVTLALVVVIGGGLPARLPFRGQVSTRAHTPDLVWEEENELGTVQVWSNEEEPDKRSMAIDGSTIGVDGAWWLPLYSKQLVIPHLAMRLDPSIRSALNVGLATATTLDTLSEYPDVEVLDAVEINSAVVEGARYFSGADVLEDPRARVVVEDISQFLLRTPRRYDLVAADGKQNPGHASNAKLLCRDFYRAVYDRLSDDGLMVQWIPTMLLPEVYASILRTFADTFPHMEVFYDPPENSFLVGSKQPILGRPGSVTADYSGLGVRADLERIWISDGDGLLALWVASREGVLAALPPGPVNTWNKSPLEFAIHKVSPEEWSAGPPANYRLLMEARAASLAAGARPPAVGDPRRHEVAELVRAAYGQHFQGELLGAWDRSQRALALDPRDLLARRASIGFRNAVADAQRATRDRS